MSNPRSATDTDSNETNREKKSTTPTESTAPVTGAVPPLKTETTPPVDETAKKKDGEPEESKPKKTEEEDEADKNKKKDNEDDDTKKSLIQQILEALFGKDKKKNDDETVSNEASKFIKSAADYAKSQLSDKENYTDADLQAFKEKTKKEAGKSWNKQAEDFSNQVITELQKQRQQRQEKNVKSETKPETSKPATSQSEAPKPPAATQAQPVAQTTPIAEAKSTSRAQIWPSNEPGKDVSPRQTAKQKDVYDKHYDRMQSVDNLMDNPEFKASCESAKMNKVDAEKIAEASYDALQNKNPDAVSDKTHLEAATKLVEKASQYSPTNDPNQSYKQHVQDHASKIASDISDRHENSKTQSQSQTQSAGHKPKN